MYVDSTTLALIEDIVPRTVECPCLNHTVGDIKVFSALNLLWFQHFLVTFVLFVTSVILPVVAQVIMFLVTQLLLYSLLSLAIGRFSLFFRPSWKFFACWLSRNFRAVIVCHLVSFSLFLPVFGASRCFSWQFLLFCSLCHFLNVLVGYFLSVALLTVLIGCSSHPFLYSHRSSSIDNLDLIFLMYT